MGPINGKLHLQKLQIRVIVVHRSSHNLFLNAFTISFILLWADNTENPHYLTEPTSTATRRSGSVLKTPNLGDLKERVDIP